MIRAIAALTLLALALAVAVAGALNADLSGGARTVMGGIAVALAVVLALCAALLRREQLRAAEQAVRRARLVHAVRQRDAAQNGGEAQ